MDRPPLPGAVKLLAYLKEKGVPFGIATSGRRPEIDESLNALQVGAGTVVIERGDVARAKPEPDLFLECQRQLGVKREDCYIVEGYMCSKAVKQKCSYYSAERNVRSKNSLHVRLYPKAARTKAGQAR